MRERKISPWMWRWWMFRIYSWGSVFDLYMFPAHLWHMVYPFSTEGIERISMSFNIDYARINGSDLSLNEHFVNY